MNIKNTTLPEWMSICSKVNELYPLHNENERLYHYTSLDGFISILENRDFWASNISFMNDEHEFEDGKRICTDNIKKIMSSSEIKYNNYLEALLKICDSNTSTGFLKFSPKNLFALSFCNDGDILTQWKFYGNNGIAIGFANQPASLINSIALMDETQYNREIEKISHLKCYRITNLFSILRT